MAILKPIRFPIWVAKRYLISNASVRFSGFLKVVAILGVIIGIAALTVTVSIMFGFGHELENKILGFEPHITVLSEADSQDARKLSNLIKEKISPDNEVVPFVMGEAILKVSELDDMSPTGVKILGLPYLPPHLLEKVKFFWGKGWWIRYVLPLRFGIITGIDVGYQAGMSPYYNDLVQLVVPFGTVDPLGNPSPTKKTYQIISQFESGLYEYDSRFVILEYDAAKKLLGLQGREGVWVTLGDKTKLKTTYNDLKRLLPSCKIYTWKEKNKKLLGALKLERMMMLILLILIILIASFSITGLSAIIYFSKRRDLAIMKALGSSQKDILLIFTLYAAMLGAIGSLFGILIGIIGSRAINGFKLPATYYLDHIPTLLNFPMLLIIFIGGILISVAAAYYPSKKARDLEPVSLLRCE